MRLLQPVCAVCCALYFIGSGFGQKNRLLSEVRSSAEGSDESIVQTRLFEQFLNNELPMTRSEEKNIYFSDLCDETAPAQAEISYLDLDNDDKYELVISGLSYYGVIVIDVKENSLYVLTEGDGTAAFCSYTFVGDEAWIIHSDTSHVGRQIYDFSKYNGEGKVTDQFVLSAEYWNEPEDRYNENSEFTYRGEKITMQDYENLLGQYLGQ